MKSCFVLAFLMPLVAGCVPSFDCENDVSQTVNSPDGAHKVVVFSRGCGATTAESTEVSLLSTGTQRSGEAGNVMSFEEEQNVTIRWKGAKRVEVVYSKQAKPPWKKSSVDGVQFQFTPK